MASAAVLFVLGHNNTVSLGLSSKAMIRLLFIHVCCCSHCVTGFVLGLRFVVYIVLHVLSSYLIILLRERERERERKRERERADCFASIVFLLSCGCQCFVSLPHSAVVWSVICDCGIS